jgi:signal transduction histidine kinase
MTIAMRLRALVVLIVVTTAVLIGGVVYFGFSSFTSQQRREGLSKRSDVEAERLHEALVSIRRDTDFLVGLPMLDSLVPDAQADSETSKELLAQIFAQLLRTRKHYSQIRYISAEGQGEEIVRVERVGDRLVRTPPHLLQPKSNRDYFQSALTQKPWAVFLHSPTLNRENGVIQVPHRQVLRATGNHPSAKGSTAGLVVVNLELRGLFDELYGSFGKCCHYVANQSGDYLYHSDPSKTFGFDLGKRHLVQEEFPLAVGWLESPNRTESIVNNTGGGLIDFRKVYLDPEHQRFLILGIAATPKDTLAQAARIGTQVIFITGALATLALFLAYLVAARTVKPVEQITRIAEQIARGGRPDSFPVERGDEVGTLARMFSQMLEKLREKETHVLNINERLSQANEDMEHFAQIASHDLREPARRVGTMADFLLTDEFERLSPSGRETVARLKEAAARLLDQITDIRSVTQVGQGRLLRVSVDLNDEVRSLVVSFEAELTKCRANSQIHELPRVFVYASLVRILYAKLVDNALSHARQYGIRLEFTGEEINGEWVFGVKNTGSSIPEDEQHRVFLPFTSLGRDSTRAGMGLSICRRIVERHSGRIWLESGADYVHVKFTLGEVHVR